MRVARRHYLCLVFSCIRVAQTPHLPCVSAAFVWLKHRLCLANRFPSGAKTIKTTVKQNIVVGTGSALMLCSAAALSSRLDWTAIRHESVAT